MDIQPNDPRLRQPDPYFALDALVAAGEIIEQASSEVANEEAGDRPDVVEPHGHVGEVGDRQPAAGERRPCQQCGTLLEWARHPDRDQAGWRVVQP